MKILGISDAHDEQVFIDKIKTIWNENEYDALFILGDITTRIQTILDFIKDIRNRKKIYIIPGNNEPKQVIERYKQLGILIHNKRLEFGEFKRYNIVGFGFSNPTPFGTPGELSEDEIYKEMAKLPIDNRTFLLNHTPPYGFFDQINEKSKEIHVGSKAIRKIIEERQPLAAFSGHIHKEYGIRRLGNTNIIKIPALTFGKYGVINIQNKISDIEEDNKKSNYIYKNDNISFSLDIKKIK